MADRQRLLMLYLSTSCLASETCAWAEYDGTGRHPFADEEDAKPPYPSVLAAMRDGWRVIKFPVEQPLTADNAGRTGPLPYEFILERIEPTMADVQETSA